MASNWVCQIHLISIIALVTLDHWELTDVHYSKGQNIESYTKINKNILQYKLYCQRSSYIIKNNLMLPLLISYLKKGFFKIFLFSGLNILLP